MKLARCPHCATIFRATPEQLEQRAGKVRCGKCRRVFNALEQLVEEPAAPAVPAAASAFAPAPPPSEPPRPESEAESWLEIHMPSPPVPPTSTPEADLWPTPTEGMSASTPDTPLGLEPEPLPAAQPGAPEVQATSEPEDRRGLENEGNASTEASAAEPVAPAERSITEPASIFPPERPAGPPGAMQEAQAAGIAAQRETRELPGFKWAEGALSAPDTHFAEPRGAPWLMTVVAIVLALMLGAQLVHQFRTELAARWPDFRPWLEEACVSLNCTVPYPRQADLVSLEASELSIDAARSNMLVLHFTLKNRADFAQDYPAVELTLTDTQDNIVVRRTLPPAEYLPPALEGSKAFAAGGEVAARLWIDAKDTGAVGYRLYVFYP